MKEKFLISVFDSKTSDWNKILCKAKQKKKKPEKKN